MSMGGREPARLVQMSKFLAKGLPGPSQVGMRHASRLYISKSIVRVLRVRIVQRRGSRPLSPVRCAPDRVDRLTGGNVHVSAFTENDPSHLGDGDCRRLRRM